MLVWGSDLELGVRVLDTHHRRLVDLANGVLVVIRDDAPRAQVIDKLRHLADFAAWHFRFEEELMEETGYLDHTHHDEQHGELLGQMERFIARVADGTAGLLHSTRTFTFLGAWVSHHIAHTDRHLADHLLRRGWDPIRDNHI